ncbi:cytochrome b/b6 domain-containing protein [Halioxenophilus sp. WMMB6]|uniref:cytochrome b/b6 domain-containing protein n=1 Tax=Halioxenophilus sp. WMMB6 TaxID=3073815 RepID=UPI00295E2C41|nr:cytochrome b/b6 domain-containing protein [Halioxenophilus sp. WMMB6]
MSDQVYVWDKFVRIFHWSLVALFALSYFTGESESPIHIYSGYAIVCLLLARIVWGFIGSKHARFSDFVKRPAAVIEYAKSMVGGHPKRFLGHNPLGGVMILLLLAGLLLTTVSGLKLYAVSEGRGPLAASWQMSALPQAVADDDHDDDQRAESAGEEFWEEVHEAGVNFLILMIILHVGGVIISSRLHGESLPKAMLTGYKRRD